MEHKLGETFEFEGNTLEVSEVEDIERPCVGCFFFGEGHHCYLEELNLAWTKTEKTTLT